VSETTEKTSERGHIRINRWRLHLRQASLTNHPDYSRPCSSRTNFLRNKGQKDSGAFPCTNSPFHLCTTAVLGAIGDLEFVDRIQLQRSRISARRRNLRAAASRQGRREGVVPLIDSCNVRIRRQASPSGCGSRKADERGTRSGAIVCISRA